MALLEAKLAQAIQQVAQLESELAASKADDARIVAEEAYARAVHEQETHIRKQDATTDRKYLDAVQKYRAAQAARERSRAMTRKVEQALAARIGGEHAIVAEVKAQLAEAKLNLSWTRIYAPANGYVTNVQLREGSYVHVGTPVLTCIDSDQWWVVANYRENSLEYLQPGQRVGLSFNTYPGRLFPGLVKTVGWGVSQGQAAPSGNLPAVHEPQNWIRLAQRFQVWVTPTDAGGIPPPHRGDGECRRVPPGGVLAQRGDRNLAQGRGRIRLPPLSARRLPFRDAGRGRRVWFPLRRQASASTTRRCARGTSSMP